MDLEIVLPLSLNLSRAKLNGLLYFFSYALWQGVYPLVCVFYQVHGGCELKFYYSFRI